VYAAARIYAQAAARPPAELASLSGGAEQIRILYQEKAVRLIRQALDALSAEERLEFWRDNIQGDNALAPLARNAEFVLLAASYARMAK
jgi:hypothetical protein